MASRPAHAGSGGIGSARSLAPTGNVAPPFDVAAPPPVHHDDALPVAPPRADVPRPAVGHRTARRIAAKNAARNRDDPAARRAAWMAYLVVLAGAVAGMLLAWHGSRYAGRGAGLLGGSMLAAALGRLVLPPRYAAVLTTRRKAADVLTFAVFGAAVLAVAMMLP